jgi:uncharacterized membrane protein YhhN
MTKISFEKRFSQVATLHLAFHLLEIPAGIMATKMLLLPLLIAFFLQKTGPVRRTEQRWMLVAMLASWLGDVLLLGGDQPGLFMAGLAAFLTAQLAYAVTFSLSREKQKGLVISKPWYALPVLALAGAVYFYLYPHLGEMSIPVSIYVLAISSMVLSAVNRLQWAGEKSGPWVLLGALSFLLSDALLAVNKFVDPVPLAGLWIMLTYITAQYLIVKGCSKDFAAATAEIPAESAA